MIYLGLYAHDGLVGFGVKIIHRSYALCQNTGILLCSSDIVSCLNVFRNLIDMDVFSKSDPGKFRYFNCSCFYHASYASMVLGVVILSVRLSVTRALCD